MAKRSKHIKLSSKQQQRVNNLITIQGSTRANAIKLVLRRDRRRHSNPIFCGDVTKAQPYYIL